MNIRRTFLLPFVLCVCVNVSLAAIPASKSEAWDWICGPRCVRYVLKVFGKEGDLADLVHEMQWPQIEQGASISSIRSALESRGIHTIAVEVPAGSVIQWPYPVIVHVPLKTSTLGHFLVYESEDGTLYVRDSYPIATENNISDLWNKRSGKVLVTSPRKILADEVTNHIVRSETFSAYLWLLPANAMLLLSFMVKSRRSQQ